jgi:uncharacterized membrane protein YjjP (DUF1212 family)
MPRKTRKEINMNKILAINKIIKSILNSSSNNKFQTRFNNNNYKKKNKFNSVLIVILNLFSATLKIILNNNSVFIV